METVQSALAIRYSAVIGNIRGFTRFADHAFLYVVELNYSYHWLSLSLSLSLSLCACLHGGMYSSFIALGVDVTMLNQHEKLGLQGLSTLDFFGK
jgi:hypothetical protein